jgi:chloramphenicol-sensitive protein RarD
VSRTPTVAAPAAGGQAPAATAARDEGRTALLAGLLCYVIWGFVPLAFQAIGHLGAGAWEIMAHRIVWGLLAAGGLVLVARQGPQVLRILRTPRTLGWLALSASLIAINWTLFVWSVNNGRTLETSLGYYITPLFNMAAGALLFRERIGWTGKAAITLAALGVAIQAAALGHAPYISLALAISFGAYGIVRKKVAADAQAGLFIECLILLGPALAYVAWLQSAHQGHFFSSPAAMVWLIASGPITAAPLALFAWAARRIPLSTMGFLQFLAPTISFFIGVAQGEPFTPVRAVSFAFIWLGAAVFLWGAWRKTRGIRPPFTSALQSPPAAKLDAASSNSGGS